MAAPSALLSLLGFRPTSVFSLSGLSWLKPWFDNRERPLSVTGWSSEKNTQMTALSAKQTSGSSAALVTKGGKSTFAALL
jgi:hypothetical protein